MIKGRYINPKVHNLKQQQQ
uniref:Uncharacterized protein n=1 Tax=Anguilla anguilla TaxID=7936 RepID=A0A0E9UCL7_ANGAN